MSLNKRTSILGLGGVCWLLLPSIVLCQPAEQTFSHITVEEGLSQSSVYAITQDANGFMWFGTRNGLNRYDSRNVVTYQNQSGRQSILPSNSINSLLTDQQGQLWVGTSKGLAYYRSQYDDFEHLPFARNEFAGLPGPSINTLVEDKQQHLWIGTSGGLYRLPPKKPYRYERLIDLIQNHAGISSQDIKTIYQDRDQTLWIGTSGGLTKLEPSVSGRYMLTNYFLAPADSIYRNTANSINAIAEDFSGRLWLGTERKGIALFDKHTGRVISWNAVPGLDLSTQTVRTIQPDGRGNFWVGTMAGLYIVAQDGSRFKVLTNQPTDAGSLNDNSVRPIFRDRDGSFWVGTYYGGVDMYSPLARQFGAYRPVDAQSEMPFKIASFMVDAPTTNQRWLGTEDRGLFLINADKTVAQHYVHDPKNSQSLSCDKVKCLLTDGSKGLWIGTVNGLNYLDLRRQTITRFVHEPNNPHSLPGNRIYDLKRDKQGTLWIGMSPGGLCRFDPATRSFESLAYQTDQTTSTASDYVNSLLVDKAGALWVGTGDGLNQKRAGQNKFTRFVHSPGDSTSVSGNDILSFLEDRRHRLWIGTRDKGLNLLMPDQHSFRHFTTLQGLPSNTILGIQEDKRGHLWLSTDRGLSQFDPERLAFINYDKYDGLICKEFTPNATYRDALGSLYFGGYNGIVYFHPDSIRRNTHVPKLAFTQLRVVDERVAGFSFGGTGARTSDKTGLTLTHRQNVFSLDFAAFNYINSAKNRYAYKLVGFDTDWKYVSEPRATYMNLPPGDYTLQVKGSNNDAVWNPHPLELSITVLPPFWKTGWAYLAYALAFLGLLRLWTRINRNRLQLAHDLDVEHLEKTRQQELHQLRLNFFTEIAHEIRTPLTLVSGPIEVLADQYIDDSFIQKQLSIVRSSTDRLLRLLNQLLDFRKQETGNSQLHRRETDLVAFLGHITHCFQEHARLRQVTLVNESEVDTLLSWVDTGEMEKVISNLLMNAFKFTPADGTIAVRLQQDFIGTATQHAVIIVEDTGSGIPAGDLERIFNWFYQADPNKTHNSGFGLGLALSKSIIDQHEGQITVESKQADVNQPGFTRFTITLPLIAPEPGSRVPAPYVSTDPAATARLIPAAVFAPLPVLLPEPEKTGESVRALILIVEDQNDIRAYIRTLLSDDYQVIEAHNGAVAWDKASQVLPDLIITDVAMPVMDGLDLTHRLKSDGRTNHIPVILLTAKDTLDNQLTGLKAGADDYVAKPFHPLLLQARVQNLLLMREQLKAKYHRIVTLQPRAQELDHPDAIFLNRLMALLEVHLACADFNVTSLVNEMGMSRPVLFRKIKMLTGLSVIDLLRTTRLKKAEMLLKQKKASVGEVAFAVGFNDPKYFSRAFHAHFGMTPTECTNQTVAVHDPLGSEIPT
ncbi:MAG: response regulator [Bacteroidetes bacterium]|nr:response regulator [Fibrella sp.]